MSIESRTSRNSITIERAGITQSDTGGEIRTFGTEERGPLPTSLACRIIPLSARERLAFGVRAAQRGWKLLFAGEPSLTLADRVRFTDSSGVERVARVVEPSTDLDSQRRLFRAVVEESENEQ
ncbi:MAG: hypothetical protein AB7O26_02745 [Planctomycetaceae bacterium]